MDTKKVKKPLSKGVRALILVGVIVGGLGAGAGIGLLMGHFLKKPVELSPEVDLNEVEDDVGNLLERYEECIAEGKNPLNTFAIHELANISMQKYTSQEYGVSYSYGNADSAVKLDIRNISIHSGDTYLEESLSKSTAGIINIVVAQRDIQHGDSDDSDIDSYLGDIKSDVESPNWSNAKKEYYKASDYEEKFGKKVSRPSVYIVSSKTVLDDGSSISKTEDGYEIAMNLDTIKGVARYRKRMMNLSGSDVKSFEYVHLTYYVDDDFNLLKSHVEEKYAAGMGSISADVTGTLRTYYFPGEKVALPSEGENISIPKEGTKNA